MYKKNLQRKIKACCLFTKEVLLLANQRNQASKADVQTSDFNKLPVPGKEDTEFSAEEAAEVFETNTSAAQASQQQEE